jgi:hypothetical protein
VGNVTSSSPGQTISNETVNGQLTINQPNVTVSNVCVRTPDSAADTAIMLTGNASNTRIVNTSAGAVDGNATVMEAAVKNWSSGPATLDHDYLYNCGECIHDGNFTVTNTYVIANGMNNTSDHRETVYLSTSRNTFNHDTMFLPPENTPAVAIVFESNAPMPPSGSTMSLTNSLLAGGDQMIEGENTVTNDIESNHFARCITGCNGSGGDSHGYWPDGGSGGLHSQPQYFSCSANVWKNNVWDDNGAAVNC